MVTPQNIPILSKLTSLLNCSRLIPESVRWLLSKKKIKEAKGVIQKCAKVNGVSISDAKLDELLRKGETDKKNDDVQVTASVIDLFKHSNLRKRSLVIFFDWYVCFPIIFLDINF